MKKKLLLLILPGLLTPSLIDSTEIPFELTTQMAYQLHYKTYSTDFRTVPTNPNVYQSIDTYLDKELTEKAGKLIPNSSFKIVAALVNQHEQLVFQLEDGSYVQASQDMIFDDVILRQVPTNQTIWLKKEFIVYSSPIANQAKTQSTDLKAYQSYTASELVETPLGMYYKLAGKGWVHADDLSISDNRMEAVQELLTTKYDSQSLAVYVKQLSTQMTAGVNQDKLLYSASIAKLPILYYVQEQLDTKNYQLTDTLQYTQESVTFPGAYQLGGSGSLTKTPDNKPYSIRDLINRTAKESDNVASNMLAYYIADQFDKDYTKVTTAIASQEWNMTSRLASAQMAGQVMEALYKQNGYVLESLSETQFDNQRIARDIPVPVAHKIGDADQYLHDVALVYSDSPFILSIFTENSDYDTISQIANDIYGILQ